MKEEPFSVQPNPRFAYNSALHEIAIAKLGYAADRKRGLGVLMGPVGAGKTTIANRLQRDWASDKKKAVGYLPSAKERTPAAFLRRVAEAFELTPKRTAAETKAVIEKFLLEQDAAGVHPVLLIDEGQDIHPDNIDTIADLINFQTAENKFLTVVILATDNFPNKLERKKAFRSRIAVGVNLDPLSFEDTCNMIAHRLKTAGGGALKKYFDQGALEQIYEITKGIPRDICVLCDGALVDGYVTHQKPVTASVVINTVNELDKSKQWRAEDEQAVRRIAA